MKITDIKEEIEDLIQLNDKMLKLTTNEWVFIEKYIKNNVDFRNEYVAHRLTSKSINIQLSIYKIIKENNYYSSYILFRSFLEHIFKAHYFIFNPENLENLGKLYYDYGEIEEFISMKRNKNAFSSINNINNSKLWDDVYENFPHIKGIQKDKIEKIIKHFGFKNMIKSLGSFFKDKMEDLNHFENNLNHYWIGSMFTHGSQGVNNILPVNFNNLSNDDVNQILNFIRMPYFNVSLTMKFLFQIFSKFDPRIEEALNNLIKIEEEAYEKHTFMY